MFWLNTNLVLNFDLMRLFRADRIFTPYLMRLQTYLDVYTEKKPQLRRIHNRKGFTPEKKPYLKRSHRNEWIRHSYSKGLAPKCKAWAFGQAVVLHSVCFCDIVFETHARETQQLEQWDIKWNALIICQSNYHFGVPVFFEDREWRHNLWQSQLCGDHATRFSIFDWQWLLNVCKSVNVGGQCVSATFLSVSTSNRPSSFSPSSDALPRSKD